MYKSMIFALSFVLAPAVTGQTTCLANNKNSSIVPSTPDAHFSFPEDGVVIHQGTGLMWMRCALGQAWDSANKVCLGQASLYTWDSALDATMTLSAFGFNDWKLPNLKALASIVEEQCWSPSINIMAFPNAPADGFWTSTPNAGFPDAAWMVGFSIGNVGWGSKTSTARVRLMRFPH